MHSNFKKLVVFGLLTLGLVSCKKDDQPLPESYIASIKDSKFLPIVEVQVNTLKGYMLLDTGSSVSVLDLNQIRGYNIKDLGEQETGITGYGGTDTTVHTVGNVRISLGGIMMDRGYVGKDIRDIVNTVQAHTGYKIIGILGNNNISGAGLKLDFKNATITR